MRTTKNSRVRFLEVSLLISACSCAAYAQSKPKQTPKQNQAHATVAGTVFRDPGFAQPGATVVLALKSAPGKKLFEDVSDARGDFSFRVPPGPAVYVVTASLKGYVPAGQEIEITDQEQINATLLLVPESKKGGK
jgi:hypothetical protein